MTCPCSGELVSHLYATIADLAASLAEAEREHRALYKENSQLSRDFVSRVTRAETAERERDEYLAACQQKHGVHPSWVTRATESAATIAERDALLEEARAIILDGSGHDLSPPSCDAWHERRRAWLERCKEVAK